MNTLLQTDKVWCYKQNNFLRSQDCLFSNQNIFDRFYNNVPQRLDVYTTVLNIIGIFPDGFFLLRSTEIFSSHNVLKHGVDMEPL